jgi:hypothetical protein
MAEGGRLERHGMTRASLSGRARPLAGSPSVRREGVEPSRPKAPVPGTGAAASYATSACARSCGPERPTGIEPASAPWQGAVLPLDDGHMEPAPGADPGCQPLPRAGGRRSGRHELGAQDSNLESFRSKPGGSAGSPTAHQSPRQVPPLAAALTRRLVVGPGGEVRSAGLEPASTRPSTVPVYQLRHERKRAATRGRTGPSAVRRRSRSRARRRSWGTRDRTWTLLIQSQACCLITPLPIG